jgi:hypothetical protein
MDSLRNAANLARCKLPGKGLYDGATIISTFRPSFNNATGKLQVSIQCNPDFSPQYSRRFTKAQRTAFENSLRGKCEVAKEKIADWDGYDHEKKCKANIARQITHYDRLLREDLADASIGISTNYVAEPSLLSWCHCPDHPLTGQILRDRAIGIAVRLHRPSRDLCSSSKFHRYTHPAIVHKFELSAGEVTSHQRFLQEYNDKVQQTINDCAADLNRIETLQHLVEVCHKAILEMTKGDPMYQGLALTVFGPSPSHQEPVWDVFKRGDCTCVPLSVDHSGWFPSPSSPSEHESVSGHDSHVDISAYSEDLKYVRPRSTAVAMHSGSAETEKWVMWDGARHPPMDNDPETLDLDWAQGNEEDS